ncbi:hypothetical protein NM688_g716 [Phlebia brevispora]|uniref:Uncharacterized protein n=1 Tax=Phlebia brevispora TaxID=194682 RepID=A0ACC1TDT3_9APHY|nr:hypothetical protein NM688_g716 [Phlebia brevispora]
MLRVFSAILHVPVLKTSLFSSSWRLEVLGSELDPINQTVNEMNAGAYQMDVNRHVRLASRLQPLLPHFDRVHGLHALEASSPLHAAAPGVSQVSNGSGKCTKCGKNTGIVSIKEHIKLYHQEKCVLTFHGKTTSVRRDSDGMWRCPVCKEDCGRHPRRLQDHARANTCVLDDEHMKNLDSHSSGRSSSDPSELQRTDHERSSSEPSSSDTTPEARTSYSALLDSDLESPGVIYNYESVDIGIDEFLSSTPSPDDGPVHEFLNSLRRPCGHLLNTFRELGIETAEDIDTLSVAGKHHLEPMKKYLVDHGMSSALITPPAIKSDSNVTLRKFAVDSHRSPPFLPTWLILRRMASRGPGRPRKSSARKAPLKDEILHPVVQVPERSSSRVRKCELSFPDGTLPVAKGADNIWRCPRCKQEFGSVARELKVHASSGACTARPRGGAVPQRASANVRPRTGNADMDEVQEGQPARVAMLDGEPEGKDSSDIEEIHMNLDPESEAGCVTDLVAVDARFNAGKGKSSGVLLAQSPSMSVSLVNPEAQAHNQYVEQNDGGELGPIINLDELDREEKDAESVENIALAGMLAGSASRSQSASLASIPLGLDGPFPNTVVSKPATIPLQASDQQPSLPPPERAFPSIVSDANAVPPALKSFLDSLVVQPDFLAELFIQKEFHSEEALDLLCQSSQEEEYRWLIEEIQAKSHLASLAVKRGLRDREKKLKRFDIAE